MTVQEKIEAMRQDPDKMFYSFAFEEITPEQLKEIEAIIEVRKGWFDERKRQQDEFLNRFVLPSVVNAPVGVGTLESCQG